MPKEIERKFILKQMPENPGRALSVKQGYLILCKDGSELRIRKYGRRHFQTLKSKGDLVRDEIEIEITKKQFKKLWPFTKGKRVFKKRYRHKENGYTFEIDVYEGAHEGLKTAEIEFKDKAKSESFEPPAWLGKEATKIPKYKNRNLAS